MSHLQNAIRNYRTRHIQEKLHVIGRKNGRIVKNGYFLVIATIETNYSRITINWDEDGVLPAEYRDNPDNRFPVDFTYFENEDKIHMNGNYFGQPYEIVVQLPPADDKSIK